VGRKRRVLVIQPYVPSYRVPLFQQVKTLLADEGIDFIVASGKPLGDDSYRQDDEAEKVADAVMDQRTIRGFGRTLLWRKVGSTLAEFDPQWVIVEQAIKNLESWPLMLKQRLPGQPKVAMWGQGRTYSTHQSRIESRVKMLLTMQADWFFSYTEAGREHVIRAGYPAERTTVLWNATDTSALKSLLSSITPLELQSYKANLGIEAGPTALFMGGVDERKGISFLLEALESIHQRIPDFTLLVAGTGKSMKTVESAHAAGLPVRILGRVSGREKALALAAADILTIPEWVGLVAVDAISSGVPVVSTEHRSHSPEIEYLFDTRTVLFSPHEPRSYASAVEEMLRDLDEWSLRAARQQSLSTLSIESMAQNFATGILSWLTSDQ
jgi:glycosyltransferase involved in cell wall biosynthesis